MSLDKNTLVPLCKGDNIPYWENLTDRCAAGLLHSEVSRKKYDSAYSIFLGHTHSFWYKEDREYIDELHEHRDLCTATYNLNTVPCTPKVLIDMMRKYPVSDLDICAFWDEVGDLICFTEIMSLYKHKVFAFSCIISDLITSEHITECIKMGIYPDTINWDKVLCLSDRKIIPHNPVVTWNGSMLIVNIHAYASVKGILCYDDIPGIEDRIIAGDRNCIKKCTHQKFIDVIRRHQVPGSLLAWYKYSSVTGDERDLIPETDYFTDPLTFYDGPPSHLLDLDEILFMCQDKLLSVDIGYRGLSRFVDDLPRILQLGYKAVIYEMWRDINHTIYNLVRPIYDEFGDYLYPRSAR